MGFEKALATLTTLTTPSQQKSPIFHAIRSWSFRNNCNEIGWRRFLRHHVSVYVCL